MKGLSKINSFRRRFMKGITGSIGSSDDQQNIPDSGAEIKKILICRPNHRLGNLLLITPLLQEVTEMFPGCRIDLFVKGYLPSIVFQNYSHVEQLIDLPRKPFKSLPGYMKEWLSLRREHYDLVINVDRNSSSGRIAARFANAKYRFFGYDSEELRSSHTDHMHMAKYPVYNLRDFLAPLGLRRAKEPVPPLDLRLSPKEIAEGQSKLEDLVKNEKKTICLFTFATGHKCYSKEWWSGFYEKLKAEYEDDYNLIEILPVENVSQLSFSIPSFYSKDVREIASVIANTEVFIGADSGIMHLASSAHTPTVGLFSVTDENRYGPYGNKSIAINTNKNNWDEAVQKITRIIKKG